MIKKKSKAQRIRELLEKGKSAHYISNTLNVTLQNIYNVRWHMKNAAKAAGVEAPRVKEATIMPSTPPKQLELDLTPFDEISQRHQEHIKAHIHALNNFNKTESIQGEYGKYQQMSVWKRIKSAIGF